MNFSLDTNIIIGAINTKDRLHEISMNLMREKQNEQLILCLSALKESTTVLRGKITDIFIEIFRLLPDISQISKLNLYDLHLLIFNIFKQIKGEKPILENFLKLVYEEVINFLKNNSIDKLPTLLSQLSIRYSRIAIEKRIEEIHPISKIITLDSDNLSSVRRALVDIQFKDNNDEGIFTELMTNLNEVKPIEFCSNDKEFAEKSILDYAEVAKIFIFNNQDFSFVLL